MKAAKAFFQLWPKFQLIEKMIKKNMHKSGGDVKATLEYSTKKSYIRKRKCCENSISNSKIEKQNH